jgi:hypothetical protein
MRRHVGFALVGVLLFSSSSGCCLFRQKPRMAGKAECQPTVCAPCGVSGCYDGSFAPGMPPMMGSEYAGEVTYGYDGNMGFPMEVPSMP